MNTLRCDIQLGGSTKQYLEWCKRNLTQESFENSLVKQLTHKAKTRQIKIARRLSCLIGLIYEEFAPEERDFYLNIVISSYVKVEKLLTK